MKKREKTSLRRILGIGIICGILLTGCEDRSVAFLEAELAKETSEESGIKLEDAAESENVVESEDAAELENASEDKNETSSAESSNEQQTESAEQTVYDDMAKQTQSVYVHVCGAVMNPGVYEMEEESRIFQALEAAGGITADAADEYVNQAMTVTDGQQIYIPTQQEVEELTLDETLLVGNVGESTNENADNIVDDGKVNINTADAAALMTISGIGEARAKDIIAYREANGGFSTIEEIMNVPGIKDATFEKIKDGIKVK